MRFIETAVLGAYVVEPEPRVDPRGSFARVFSAAEFRERGLSTSVVQANLATTLEAGTVRGLHYQLPPAAEAKYLRCIQGAVFDVVLDLRRSSPTFGSSIGIELTSTDGAAVFVPEGCAHGYQALEDRSTVLYQVSAAYDPALERGVHHADPAIGIAWPCAPRNLSSKDLDLPLLRDAELPDVAPS